MQADRIAPVLTLPELGRRPWWYRPLPYTPANSAFIGIFLAVIAGMEAASLLEHFNFWMLLGFLGTLSLANDHVRWGLEEVHKEATSSPSTHRSP